MAATAPLGMPSGKNEHHPGWKPLQGSASDRIPGWAPRTKPVPVPAPRGPVPGYDQTCLRRVFTAATVSSTPSRAPENVVRVNPFQARKCVRGKVCRAVGVRASGRQFLKSYYECLPSAIGMCTCVWACVLYVAAFFGQGRSRLNLGSSYCVGLVGAGQRVRGGVVVSSMSPAFQVDSRVPVCPCGHRLSRVQVRC